ncbi:HAMP domain-containing sensor histidine kinase [Anaerolentibacter hominis]|uniref:sensor histidine kinase n=1 Tax=Anaerolentibacter hominis TaxID=3079009 RepID=UPI0031B7FFC4
MKKAFGTIRSKIMGIIALILLCIMAVLFFINFSFSNTYYLQRRSNALEHTYQDLVQLSTDNPDVPLNTLLSGYENDTDAHILVADSSYRCIFDNRQYKSNGDPADSLNNTFNFERFKDLYSTSPFASVRKNENKDIDSTRYLQLFGIIPHQDQTFYVVLRSSLTAIAKTRGEVNWYMTLLSAAAFSVGAVLIYLVAKRMSEPVVEIEQVANRIASLDFSVRARTGRSKDELGQLANSINIMADNLEQTIGELKEKNHLLQEDNEYRRKIDEMRRDFVANVSHELKTPLSVLTGYTEILKNTTDEIDRDYYYDVILDETQKMNRLISDLMDLSGIEHGLKSLEVERTDLTSIAAELLEKNRILFDERSLHLEYSLPGPCYVMGNELYLRQAMNNFLMNAVAYTKKDGTIRAEIRSTEDQVVFSVYNDGMPISNKLMENIWDGFYRGDRARTRTAGDHMGLGLYIVRTIIEAHHGSYGVQNEEHGITFYFSLKKMI